MTIRDTTVGSPTGRYYERWKQNGGDTPKRYRELGIFWNNSYSMERESMVDVFPMTAFYAADGTSKPVPAANQFTRSFFTLSASSGTKPALSEIYAKLDNLWKNTDINLAMYLSPEGRESVTMTAESVGRIANAALDLKKGNLTGFFRNLKQMPRSDRRRVLKKYNQGDLSGSFLAAHLGWEPLIKDAYSASEGFKPAPPKSTRIKASKGHSGNFYRRNPTPYTGTSFKGFAKGVTTIVATVDRPPTTSERFGMANPFMVAWELVPLSFVADYFLPISTTIQALGFVGMQGARRGWIKEYTEQTAEIICPPGTLWLSDSNGKKYYNRQTASLRKHFKTASRKPYELSLSDALSIRNKIPTSVMKLGTLAALAHQRILALGSTKR